MAACTNWHDAIVVASIVLSAGTYLFDFSSNVVVLVQYSTRFFGLMQREQEGVSSCDAVCRHQTSELAGYFYALLAVLACCHSLNALLFKLKFTRNEAPLFAAYFLPLIHLYRLTNLLWRTLSCTGIQDLRSPEMNGLYCILGSAMEGVPMLVLQFCGYLVLTRERVFVHSMSITFKVSVAASLASAAYNGGTSVQSMAKNATSLKQKLGATAIGASFTLTATLVRCLTFTYVIVYIRQYFSRQRTEREQAKFHVSDSIPLLVIAGSILAYFLYFWLLHSPREFSKSLRNTRRLLTALAFSYMSMNLGPLYPLISQANDANQLGSYAFRLKLLTVSLLHLLLDVTVLCVTKMLGTLPELYMIVSSLTAMGYMVSLIAYMRLDASCGLATSSSESINMLATQYGDDNDDDYKVIPLSELGMLANAARAQEMEKSEVDAIARRHLDSSSHNTNLARCEKAGAMGFALEGACPLEKHNMGAHPHDVLVPEAKECRPVLRSSRSLDSIAMRRERLPLDRPFGAYSERVINNYYLDAKRGHPLH